MEYETIRSRRKTFAIEIKSAGRVVVRAPFWASDEEVGETVALHRKWIERKLSEMANKSENKVKMLTEEETAQLAAAAKETIPRRVRHYAPLVGADFGRITLRIQKTRWGSCSAKGNLNFNCLLMLAPPEVLDSVVVHELCHRKHMNHSKEFYKEALRVFPEYYKCREWLKRNGNALLGRYFEGV